MLGKRPKRDDHADEKKQDQATYKKPRSDVALTQQIRRAALDLNIQADASDDIDIIEIVDLTNK